MLLLIKNIINNNETSIPGPAGPVLCTVCTPLCSVLAAPPIHQVSRLVVWSPRPPPRPSYQNTDLIKWSQNISQIVSSFLQMFWWNFCLLYYSLRRLECSSVSRDVSPPMGGEDCPGGRGEIRLGQCQPGQLPTSQTTTIMHSRTNLTQSYFITTPGFFSPLLSRECSPLRKRVLSCIFYHLQCWLSTD